MDGSGSGGCPMGKIRDPKSLADGYDNTKYPPVEYGEYLGLDKLLTCQNRKSEEFGKPAHDEMLFIVVHQAHELWFKQILHEVQSVMDVFQEPVVDDRVMGVVCNRLNRIGLIQHTLNDHLKILETMSSLDFLDFREFLLPASGFQSVQFRQLEILMGLRENDRVSFQNNRYYEPMPPSARQEVEECEAKGLSLFRAVEQWLERMPFDKFGDFNFWQLYKDALHKHLDEEFAGAMDSGEVEKEKTQLLENFRPLFDEDFHNELIEKGSKRLSFKATGAALFIHLYRDEPVLQMPFRLLTALVDMDQNLQTWRAAHAHMVHRMIGIKSGTGGSSGYYYLKSTLAGRSYKVFMDLFNLSSYMIPRSALPKLPPQILEMLDFTYSKKMEQ